MEQRLGWELTHEERTRYGEEGFFVREAVFAPAELDVLRDAVEAIHRRIEAAAIADGAPPEQRVDGRRYQDLLGSTVKWEWAEGSREVRSMEPFLHLDLRLAGLVDDLRLTAPVAALLGLEKLSLFTDKLNFKRPGGAPFPWHQDTPYWAFGCAHLERLCSLQLYLDEARRDNGCLWAVAGSHRGGTLPGYQDRGSLQRLYTHPDGFAAHEAVPIEAGAGSLIFFNGDLVHGSWSNRSACSRRALVLTYQPAGHPRWNRTEVRDISPAPWPAA